MSKLKGETHESGAALTAVPLFFAYRRPSVTSKVQRSYVRFHLAAASASTLLVLPAASNRRLRRSQWQQGRGVRAQHIRVRRRLQLVVLEVGFTGIGV